MNETTQVRQEGERNRNEIPQKNGRNTKFERISNDNKSGITIRTNINIL